MRHTNAVAMSKQASDMPVTIMVRIIRLPPPEQTYPVMLGAGGDGAPATLTPNWRW